MNKNLFKIILMITVCATFVGSTAAQNLINNSDAGTSGKPTKDVEESVKLETSDGNLYGTLLLPPSKKKMPIVLIISGSGPTDRNGNSPLLKGANNSLKLLAESLAANGIASLRYDKRGIGESGKEMLLMAQKTNRMPRPEDLRFDAYVDDAVLWGQRLRGDRRFSTVTIAGHSEGSLIGMIAARKMRADAYVSIAGAGRPAAQILLEQIKKQLPSDLANAAGNILDQLTAGKPVESVPPALNNLFHPSIQPYMISWLRFDPAKEIAALSIPVLVLQGTTDLQVSLDDAKLLSGSNPNAKLKIIEGMNHVLKSVSIDADKQTAAYSDSTLPIAPEIVSEISRFVKRTRKY